MEVYTALFVAGREGFFKEKACINCPVDCYCACDGVDILFDIDSVLVQSLIDVGQGVAMSEPLKVEKGLMTGDNIYASLSHQGILAVCNNGPVQFIDLNTNREEYLAFGLYTLVGFYDSMILLLGYGDHPREAVVKRVFENARIETFQMIEGIGVVYPFTDVSLLHERRVLYYRRRDDKLFSFNVDTRMNVEIDVGRGIWSMPSFTGISCDVRVVFKDYDDSCTYTLNNDNTITKVNENHDYPLTTLFSSMSDPKNIKNAMFKYGYDIVKSGNKIDTSELIGFGRFYSVIRIYRDIFLAYDTKTESWIIFRLIVP